MFRHAAPVLAPALAAALALAACNPAPSETAPAGEDTAAQPQPAAPSPTASAPVGRAPSLTIPSAFHGRWGMVPADCDPARDDAKGLITISAGEIKYYESVARPARVAESAPDRLKAVFAFTGEGMEWEREMTLSVSGESLTLDDVGEDTAPEPELRTRCG